MSSSSRQNIKKSRIKLLHQYYTYTGFYSFLKSSLGKLILPAAIFMLLLWLTHLYFIDFNDLFTSITTTYNPLSILVVFLASETLLGLIPPEIFIAWADKTNTPIIYLSILATLSYVGGIFSFFIGKAVARTPSFYKYLTVKMNKQVKMISKWGGLLIVAGALLPIPFSITSIAAGMIHYRFRNYLLFGALRYVRFFLYAIVIFNVF
jgi:membrane protein YqaA with SNARE-associated domain